MPERMFRSVRFSVTEAHGKGVALQFNYLNEVTESAAANKTADTVLLSSQWWFRKNHGEHGGHRETISIALLLPRVPRR